MRDTEKERQRHRKREKQAPCREPFVELDLRTPGSRPELKADAQPLSYPGVPGIAFILWMVLDNIDILRIFILIYDQKLSLDLCIFSFYHSLIVFIVQILYFLSYIYS